MVLSQIQKKELQCNENIRCYTFTYKLSGIYKSYDVIEYNIKCNCLTKYLHNIIIEYNIDLFIKNRQYKIYYFLF
jgi:hypothetical protein